MQNQLFFVQKPEESMGTDTPTPSKSPEDVCPNCFQEGRLGCLVISKTGVKHCGCYYNDADERSAIVHFSRDPGRAEQEAEAAFSWTEHYAKKLREINAEQERCLRELIEAQKNQAHQTKRAKEFRSLAEAAAHRLRLRLRPT
ncbi:hypothetical protein KBB27_00600 [Patescibacteria group bacterium]|nr:hypothetical protein [Patescibacteria group bacterium]